MRLFLGAILSLRVRTLNSGNDGAYSLLWVLQDLDHHPYHCAWFVAYGLGLISYLTHLFKDLYKEFTIRNPKKVGSLGSR